MSYNTLQSPEQLRENVALLKRMMGEKTVIHIIPEQGMTQKQLQDCHHNSAAFDNYLRSKHTTPEGVDYSLQNIKTAYIFLRDNGLLQYEVAPKINKPVMLDHYGRPVRDLRAERREAAEREAEEARQPRRTFEDDMRKAQRNVEIGKGIEEARTLIASYRGRYHSDTFKFREAAQAVLDKALANDRTLGGILSAISEIKSLSHKYYRD
jgi:hypothetical protein